MRTKLTQIFKNKLYLITIFVMIIGCALRVICCFWGSPLQLHPDEFTVVDYAMDMLERNSWEAHVFYRPDHFEIKCNAILFTIFSWLKYHKPAPEAFAEHKLAFHWVARFFTVFFGVGLIPLIGLFAWKISDFLKVKYRNVVYICTIVIIGFSSIYIQHSAYATPDIVLTFFVMLFTLFSIDYITKGDKKSLYLNMVIIGIGITIKYPAAILCIPFAGMVIYRAYFIDKKISDIFRYGFASIAVIFFTVFVISPNLITDYSTVITTAIGQNNTKLGYEGDGFIGNIKYYFNCIVSHLGTVSLIPFVFGLIAIIFHRNKKMLSFFVGIIYCACMSVLSLKWLRWGFPMYPFYIVIMTIGIGTVYQLIVEKLALNKMIRFSGTAAVSAYVFLQLFSVILSGFAITKFSSLPDIRYFATQYFKENGITEDECLSEAYTPFAPERGTYMHTRFFLTDTGVRPKMRYAAKKYLVITNSFKSRYFAQSAKYPNETAIYKAFDSTYKVLYKVAADGNYSTNRNIIKNIRNTIAYLGKKVNATGSSISPITLYDLAPVVKTIQSMKNGKFLYVSSGDADMKLEISEEDSGWVFYEHPDHLFTILESSSGNAIDLSGYSAKNKTIKLASPNGKVPQKFSIEPGEDGGEWFYLVTDGNKALTCVGNKVVLSAFTRSDRQKWKINIL